MDACESQAQVVEATQKEKEVLDREQGERSRGQRRTEHFYKKLGKLEGSSRQEDRTHLTGISESNHKIPAEECRMERKQGLRIKSMRNANTKKKDVFGGLHHFSKSVQKDDIA